MAQIVGRVALSHGPQLLLPPERWNELPTRAGAGLPERPEIAHHLTPEGQAAHAQRNADAMERLREHVDALKPGAIVVIGDDQHENLLDDAMPAITMFLGSEVLASLRTPGDDPDSQKHSTRYAVHEGLSRHLLQGLMDRGFDPAWSTRTRQEYGLGHAFGRPLRFVTPGAPYPIVAVMLNTYYPPAPSPARCIAMGQALAAAVEDYPGDERVVFMASGGLSHTIIEEDLDGAFMDAVQRHDLDFMAGMDPARLVTGTSELRNWIAVAAAGSTGGRIIDYVPAYRTATGVGCSMGFALWH